MFIAVFTVINNVIKLIQNKSSVHGGSGVLLREFFCNDTPSCWYIINVSLSAGAADVRRRILSLRQVNV